MTGCNRLFIIAALLASGRLANGQDDDVGSLHGFNGTLQLTEKTRLTLHGRLRFNEDLSDFYQLRVGPIVTYDWRPRIQWQGGYYVVEQRSERSFVTIQRPWAGGQIRVYRSGGLTADWRNLIERHAFSGPGDFTRFRSRMLIAYMVRSKWQPFGGVEGLVQQGRLIRRYSAGVNYATDDGSLFGFGYEFRGVAAMPGSHFITTMVQFRIR